MAEETDPRWGATLVTPPFRLRQNYGARWADERVLYIWEGTRIVGDERGVSLRIGEALDLLALLQRNEAAMRAMLVPVEPLPERDT